MKLQLLFSTFAFSLAVKDGVRRSIKRNEVSDERSLEAFNVRVVHSFDAWKKAMKRIDTAYGSENFEEFLGGEKTVDLEKGANDVGMFDINVGSIWKKNTIDGSSYVGVYKKGSLDIKLGNFAGGKVYGFAFKVKEYGLLPDKPDDDKPIMPSKGVPEETGLIITVGTMTFNFRDIVKKGEDGFIGFVSQVGFESLGFDMRTERGPAYTFTADEFYVSIGIAVIDDGFTSSPTTKITSAPTPTLAPTNTKFPTLNPTIAPETPIELVVQILESALDLFLRLDWATAWERLQEGWAIFIEFYESDASQGFIAVVSELVTAIAGDGN